MSFSSNKLFDDDDDDIQGSNRKTNLGNIFGAATQAPTDTSLSYQRPKAPQKSEPTKTTAKSTLPPLLHSLRVELYKPNTSPAEYTAIGAAIVENGTGSTKFQLILYYTREKLIAVAPITKDFVLTIQNQDGVNYGSFHDSASKKDWSFRLASQDDADALAIHIAIARFYENPTQVVLQDIYVPTKGSNAAKDDMLGVRFVAYTQKSGKLSTPIEDNLKKPQPTKFVVGGTNKGSFPGWDVALDGMRRTGCRVVVVPEDSDSSKIYKLTIEKMKRASQNTVNESAPSSGKLPKASQETSNQEEEHTEASPPDNSAILQRMAKLTVATPFAGATKSTSNNASSANVSDSEATTHVEQQPAPVPQPQQAPAQQPSFGAQITPQSPMQPMYPQQNMYGQMQPQPYGMQASPYSQQNPMMASAFGSSANGIYGNQQAVSLYNPQQQQQHPWEFSQGMPWGAHPMAPLQQNQAVPPSPVNTNKESNSSSSTKESPLSQGEAIQLLIDGRQFQSEIKATLTKMTHQLEDVEERLEGTVFTKNKDLGSGVTAKVLLQTVSRIVSENERMSAELETRDQRIEQMTDKMNKLHETNQRVIEENNRFMEERTSNFKTATDSQIRQLEQFREEKTNLEMELTSANRQFQTLKRSFTNVSNELEQVKEEMERLRAERDAAVGKYANIAGASQSAESKLIEEQTTRRKLELDVQQLRDELAMERETLETVRRDTEDKKTRFQRELANFQQQAQEEKAALDDQINKLQEALRKERAHLGASAEQAQAEIESKWSAKLKADVQRVQSALEAEWEAKFESHKATIETEARDRVRQLQHQHSELIAQMNAEFEAEKAAWASKEQQFRKMITQLQDSQLQAGEAQEIIAQLRTEVAEAQASTASTIKSIMNNVYITINDLFEDGEQIQYDKSGIMETLKSTIVSTTKSLLSPDEPQAQISKPAPVAPIRVEVPVEVPVEVKVPVPVKTALVPENSLLTESAIADTTQTLENADLMAHDTNDDKKDDNEHVEESSPSTIVHERTESPAVEVLDPLSPTLERVDSEVHVFISNSTNDPLSSEEVEAPVVPAQPVDDGWTALDHHEPDFVEPEAPVSTAVEPSDSSEVETDPLSVVDPLSASDPLSTDPLSADPLSDPLSTSDPLSAPEEQPAEVSTQIEEISSPLEEKNTDETVAEPIVEEPVHEENVANGVDEEVAEVKAEEVAQTADSEAETPAETTESSDIPVSTEEEEEVKSPEDSPVVEDVAHVEPASESAPAQVSVAIKSPLDDEDPFGVEEVVAKVEPTPESATQVSVKSPLDDDDPFGVEDDAAKAEPAPQPAVASPVKSPLDDEDPFGVEDVKPAPAVASPAAKSPSFFEETTPVKANAPVKKSASFFDDDEEEEKVVTPKPAPAKTGFFDDEDEKTTPKASVVPSTEPKKKKSSFFDDDDDGDIVPKKAPSSASKSTSFLDDDDPFAPRKTTKKPDLDDIFGEISSKPAAKKGIFDD